MITKHAQRCETCNHYDKFFSSCKVTWYETSIQGKKEIIHPRIEQKDEWLINQVGCFSYRSTPVSEQQELVSSEDIIKDLEQSLEWYKKRVDMLQCWQSSMRDPERKIVCDILANGFTLTSKEEIDKAHERDFTPKSSDCIACEKAIKEKYACEQGLHTDLEMEDAESKGFNRGNECGQEIGAKAERERLLKSCIDGFSLIIAMCRAGYRYEDIADSSMKAIAVLESIRHDDIKKDEGE